MNGAKFSLGSIALAAALGVAGGLPKSPTTNVESTLSVNGGSTILNALEMTQARSNRILDQRPLAFTCLNHGDLYAGLVGLDCENAAKERDIVLKYAERLNEYILSGPIHANTQSLTRIYTNLTQAILQRDIEEMRGRTHLLLVELVNIFNAGGLEDLPETIRIEVKTNSVSEPKDSIDKSIDIMQYVAGFQFQLLYLTKDSELLRKASKSKEIMSNRRTSIETLRQIIQEIQKQSLLDEQDRKNQENSTRVIEALKEKYFTNVIELYPKVEGYHSFEQAEFLGAQIARTEGIILQNR